jgi:hypothetical protein
MIEPVWEFEHECMTVRAILHSCGRSRCRVKMDMIGRALDVDDAWVAVGGAETLILPGAYRASLEPEDVEFCGRLGALLGVRWEQLSHERVDMQVAVLNAMDVRDERAISEQAPEELYALRRWTTSREDLLMAVRSIAVYRGRALEAPGVVE